ncbi:MAG: NAD(P)H-hydrate epimerase [Spirochaetes bacterium]|jgi:NAD(P)H-hydrate epimerase|nr:NAD(P)H-hydrate epimerase [Spirochaetota bacterium]
MREIDRIAMEETGPNIYQMMENAGRNLAELSLEMLSDTPGGVHESGSILVAAGTGGNGGGGICAARHLANHGRRVVLAITRGHDLPDVTAQQLKTVRAAGVRVLLADSRLHALAIEESIALVVDAVLGYSARGEPRGGASALLKLIAAVQGAQSGTPTISLDLPSGTDATTGEAPGAVVTPSLTMTLALPKIGLARARTGRLVLSDIGIPAEVYRRAGVEGYESPFGSGYRVDLKAQQSTNGA